MATPQTTTNTQPQVPAQNIAPEQVAERFLTGGDVRAIWDDVKQAFFNNRPQALRALVAATARVLQSGEAERYLKRFDIFGDLRQIIRQSPQPTDTALSLFRDIQPAEQQAFLNFFLAREAEFPWAADTGFAQTLIKLGAATPDAKHLQNIRKFIANTPHKSAAAKAESLLALLQKADINVHQLHG